MSSQEPRISQAESVQRPKRWPLVTQPSNRSTNFLQDARLVNCYAEKDEAEGTYQIEKRFGFSATDNAPGAPLPSGVGRGIFPWLPYTAADVNSLYTVAIIGSSVYFQSLGSPGFVYTGGISLGAAGQSNTCAFLSIPNQTTPYLLFGAGLYACYMETNGIPVAITGGFPANVVRGFGYLDSYIYVMDSSGTIWESVNENDPTSWTVVDTILAGAYPDQGVAIANQLTYIIALKSNSTQFFYDAGNTVGSSLDPVPGALLNIGCASADTLQELDGVLYFVTQNRQSALQIGMLDNLQFTVISTPAIDRLLIGSPGTNSAPVGYGWTSMAFERAGHKFYAVTNTFQNITLVYDIGQKLWYQWTDSNGNFFPLTSITAGPSGTTPLLGQSIMTGALYYVDADYVYPNDNGVITPVDIYTPDQDFGVHRIKHLSQMRFNADQTAGSRLWIRYSENDYSTWTNFRQVDLGQKEPLLNDEGSFYHRAYHFRHAANTAFRMDSVDLQMDIGTL